MFQVFGYSFLFLHTTLYNTAGLISVYCAKGYFLAYVVRREMTVLSRRCIFSVESHTLSCDVSCANTLFTLSVLLAVGNVPQCAFERRIFDNVLKKVLPIGRRTCMNLFIVICLSTFGIQSEFFLQVPNRITAYWNLPERSSGCSVQMKVVFI